MKTPNTIFDNDDLGDSPIYVGINYLRIVASQMDLMRQSARFAYQEKGDMLFLWLHELKTFYDLIESRTGLQNSDKKIKLFEYEFKDNKLERKEVEVEEKEKYEKWFKEIELMIERNMSVQLISGANQFKQKKYLNDKEILSELSKCMRTLLKDGNLKHFIMPEGQKDWKELAKSDWIDRGIKKEFGNPSDF